MVGFNLENGVCVHTNYELITVDDHVILSVQWTLPFNELQLNLYIYSAICHLICGLIQCVLSIIHRSEFIFQISK